MVDQTQLVNPLKVYPLNLELKLDEGHWIMVTRYPPRFASAPILSLDVHSLSESVQQHFLSDKLIRILSCGVD